VHPSPELAIARGAARLFFAASNESLMQLAVDSYRSIGALGDGPELLDLAWTSDEQERLAIDLRLLVAEELRAEAGNGLDFLSRYLVQDPYAERLLAGPVGRFFGLGGPPPAVTAGAGVGSLLAAAAGLAGSRPVQILGSVYPDFPAWVERTGGRVAEGQRPGLIFLERPQLTGSWQPSRAEIGALCRAAPDAIVVIDESNANYCPPEESLVPAVSEWPNLLILRGFSKAYQMGGLRLGYCVSQAPMAEALRHRLPPLLASSLSLRIGIAILEQGDICVALRQAIAAALTRAKALFAGAGWAPDRAAHPALPYLLFDSANEARIAAIEARGIRGKRHAGWQAGVGATSTYRISVPLVPARMEALQRRLAGTSSGSPVAGRNA